MRARLVAFVVAGVVAVGAAVGAVLLLTAPDDDVVAPPAPAPSVTRSAPPSPTPSPTPSFLPAFVAMAVPERVEIPAVDLDLAVLPISPVGGRINPPTVEEAYWIQDYGLPGSDADNTVYLVGHSSLRMPAAFNPLLDVEHQDAVLQPGDEVRVTTAGGVLRYEVTGWTRYDKDGLPTADEVWAIAPGTLQIITCFQEDGREFADDNLVVTATLVEALVPAEGATAG
ncbi:class F sortase [Actinotalea fermentans]|uniref:Class F sortase n=1 Tax=Actinotalea fermentans TaxID=43671 RepID=A0A511Z025_9CELL|nr:class F sortase [Actinotalea fermentans]KGM15483.1 hypothetical protein N867_08065 [Actinotalea fermentans ATCC 43279 = JCM 9966 = DSM 3133]GEN80792.1 hypothetical protein AFE02nite_25260 [Actinotalea fermentans]